MFGKGDNGYLGVMATEDIGKNETIVRVPSHLIINTKTCYQCEELKDIFYDNP